MNTLVTIFGHNQYQVIFHNHDNIPCILPPLDDVDLLYIYI